MAQMNFSTGKKQTNKLMDMENRFVVAKREEEGVGWVESLGFRDADDDTENGSAMRSCCPA